MALEAEGRLPNGAVGCARPRARPLSPAVRAAASRERAQPHAARAIPPPSRAAASGKLEKPLNSEALTLRWLKDEPGGWSISHTSQQVTSVKILPDSQTKFVLISQIHNLKCFQIVGFSFKSSLSQSSIHHNIRMFITCNMNHM